MVKRVVGRTLVLGVGLGLGVFIIGSGCSSKGAEGRGGGGNNDAGDGSGGNGPIIDPGVIDTDGGPPVDPMLPTCDASTPCADGQVCVAKEGGGGVCSPAGQACDPLNDTCDNDTYCCAQGCRLDGVAEGVCVVGATRPVNKECTTSIAVGVFAPDLQCEWTTPPQGDLYPNHKQVYGTPLVANLPNNSGTAAEIVFVSSDRTTASGYGGGRIRILNGQTCQQVEVITDGPAVRDAATPAIGDLDGDGVPEIVAHTGSTIVAYKWNGSAYGVMWSRPTAHAATGNGSWEGVSLHDLNNDGKAEVVGRAGEVLDGSTGNSIAAGGAPIILTTDPVVGDVDADGTPELVANKVFTWSGNRWTEKYPGPGITAAGQAIPFYGFADFGKRNGPGSFDHKTKDGIAEIVAVGSVGGDEQSGTLRIYTLQGEQLMRVDFAAQPICPNGQAGGERGGPPTIGDFDGDGMPEVASAGAFAYRVYDLDCQDTGQNCADSARWIRWSKPIQDCSSGQTGSTIFDFEGDGRVEAVYADECFLRVYDGLTGDTLFSTYRSSATWWEQPIVADTDNSDRSKIVYGGATNYGIIGWCRTNVTDRMSPKGLAYSGHVDATYAGVRCRDDNDCISKSCVEGFCRCTTDEGCGNNFVDDISDNVDVQNGLVCMTPLSGTPGAGNVCRMMHGGAYTDDAHGDKYYSGIKVWRDKLDRWASSRPLWNQHVYTITNINDNTTVPKTSEWQPNFKDPNLNNFRQNRQGSTSADLADITGALNAADACASTQAGGIVFTGKICNRGLRGVGANMPASFYLGEVGQGAPVCQTQTDGPVPVGGCKDIKCEIASGNVPPGSTITMVVNDAGSGARITDECNYENNTSPVTVDRCDVVR